MIGAQLPKPIENPEMFLLDDEWVMQEKFDGIRLTITKDENGNVVCGDRNGVAKATPELLKPLVNLLISSDEFLAKNSMLDGEYLPNGIYKAFDLVDLDRPDEPFELRYENLLELSNTGLNLEFAWWCRDSLKNECMVILRGWHAEGVVFKRKDSPYTPGKHSDWRKFKFVKDVDCVVIDKGIDGKDNIELGLYTPDGLKSVGKCSAVTGDGPRVKNGDVVTVTYLYVTKGRRLYQPVTPRLRTDKKPEECGFDQLKENV